MEGGRSLLKKKLSSARQEQFGASLRRDSSVSRTTIGLTGTEGVTDARRGSRNLSSFKKSCFAFCNPQSKVRETNDSDVTTSRDTSADGPTFQTHLSLRESATDLYFSLPTLAVVADSDAYWNTAKRNKEYEQLTAARLQVEKYTVNHSQTTNRPLKMKEVSAVLPPPVTAGAGASPAEIYDAFHTSVLPRGETVQQQWIKKAKEHMDYALQLPGSLLGFDKSSMQYNHAMPSSPRKNALPHATALNTLRGAQATKSRHNEVTSGLPQELTKILVKPGTASPLHASGSTRNVRRRRPSLQKVAAPGVAADHSWTMAGIASSDPCSGQIWEKSLDLTRLGTKLAVMYKVLVQTRYHPQQMAYCNYRPAGAYKMEEPESGKLTRRKSYQRTNTAEPSVQSDGDAPSTSDEEEESEPRARGTADKNYIERIFSFNGRALTSATDVACVEWSTGNADLLAVGHGRAPPSADGVATAGHILFWSMRNPLYPERIIRTTSGVMCLSFSALNPNLLVAGLADGHILLWDLRKKDEQPALQSHRLLSSRAAARHSDAVWDVRWVDRGPEFLSREQIMSIAGDGTVNQWALKKGLEKTVLMSIKRASNPLLEVSRGTNHEDSKLDSVAFRYATGLCIDISQQNPSTYLIGTDEGLIHRCSISYNEQYLDTYFGHTAPVTKVRYNPFDNNVFLSCSDDGTMRLWCTTRTDSAVAILPPSTSFAPVADVSWCPSSSAAFVACTATGRVDFWDLARQQAEPAATHSPDARAASKNTSFTSVRFSAKRSILAVGDNDGNASVLRLKGMHAACTSPNEQTEQLQSIISKRARP